MGYYICFTKRRYFDVIGLEAKQYIGKRVSKDDVYMFRE